MYQENEGLIRDRAHAIWEREGCPEGRSEIHWEMAREEIAIAANQSAITLPNPVAEGKIYSDGTDDAEPITAAEEAFGDMPGPSTQGENPPYPFKPSYTKKAV